jgi:hypothetical protein
MVSKMLMAGYLDEIPSLMFVTAGLDPAIPTILALSCYGNRDARHKSLPLGRPKAGPEGRA